MVTPITPRVINEIFQLREVLEPYVVSVVTPDFPETDLLEFREGFRQKAPERYDELMELDDRLHNAIIYAFGNSYLGNLMENMYTQNVRIRVLSTMLPQRLSESYDEHLVIVEAMLAREPQKAAEAMRYHLRRARHVALSL